MSRLGVRLALLVLLALGLLLAALWWAPGPFAWGRQWRAPDPRAPNLDAIRAALVQRGSAAAGQYPGVLERPLFSASRSASASAASGGPPPPPPEPVLEGVRVTGIIAGPQLAGVMVQEGDNARFVRVGDEVKGWTLARLDGRKAVFQREQKEQVMDLEVAEGGGQAPEQDATTVVRSGGARDADAAADAGPAVMHPSGATTTPTARARGAQSPARGSGR